MHPFKGFLPNPVALLFKVFHWTYFFLQWIPCVLHLLLGVRSTSTFLELPYKVCITQTIQAPLRPIVSKNFFCTDIIEHLDSKRILFCLNFCRLIHLKPGRLLCHGRMQQGGSRGERTPYARKVHGYPPSHHLPLGRVFSLETRTAPAALLGHKNCIIACWATAHMPSPKRH